MEKEKEKKESYIEKREKEKRKYKNKNFFEALKYALSGLKEIFLSERNIRIQVFFAIIAVILSFILTIDYKELLIILVSISLVIISEILNTMVEKILDLYTLEYNDEVKIIKDMAAGGVLFATTFSVIIGGIIFIPKIIKLILI